jgi:hypothetical protein
MENMRNVNSFQLGILNGRCHVGNEITDEKKVLDLILRNGV